VVQNTCKHYHKLILTCKITVRMHVITRFSFIYCLLMYITYKVYQMGRSAPKSLSSLSLRPERKCKCYNGYFVNGYVFHTEEYRQGRLEEVIELQYHNEQNIVFLFKCYWYDTTDRVIRVDPHYGLVEINSKARLRNINDVFVFAKQCQQVYYTYTPSFRKD